MRYVLDECAVLGLNVLIKNVITSASFFCSVLFEWTV